MKDYKRLINRVKVDEGIRLYPYRCSLDKWTIGYGSTRLFTGRGWTSVRENTLPITETIAEYNLILGLHDAYTKASKYVTNFTVLSGVRQAVLTMMAYQLGGSGLRKFVKTKYYIEHNEWKKARDEMLKSKWARQTPKRAERTADMFYLDRWL